MASTTGSLNMEQGFGQYSNKNNKNNGNKNHRCESWREKELYHVHAYDHLYKKVKESLEINQNKRI